VCQSQLGFAQGFSRHQGQIGWRPPPLAIVRERLFLKAGRKTFGYPRHAPFGNGERRSRSNNSALRTFVPGSINGCSDFPSGNWALVASSSRVSHGRRQTPQNMERGDLFQHHILERHAFRIVLLEPLFRGVPHLRIPGRALSRRPACSR